MSLEEALAAFQAEAAKAMPPRLLTGLQQSIDDLKRSGIVERALKVGEVVPAFTLPNAAGRQVSISDLLERGPVIITFYRGLWCPYCNLELRAYQRLLPEIRDRGATLVAVSPQTSDSSLTTAEKNSLEFELLSDLDNRVAELFGIAYEVPAVVRAITEKFGHHLPAYNGSDDWRLPVSATYVVARDGKIILAEVDVDFRRRLEPRLAIDALRRPGDEDAEA